MAEALQITTERVDDIPLLLAQLDRMGVQPLLDEHFPTHGNWVGLSLGWVTVIWLAHILSEANHRLNHVEPWAEQRLHTLRGCTGQPVHPLDLSDDRLAGVLEVLSHDEPWQAFEGAFTQQLLRVYALQPERVRLDSITASGYWSVTEDGLLQCGHSKDHRPDLPQVKVMLSVLDPLGLPVATDIVPGQRADDPRYLPAINRVRESIGRRGLLYVGDGKMGTLETRASLHAGGDCYLCPLAEVQLPPAVLEGYLAPVASGQQPLMRITRLTATGTRQHLADGDERLEFVVRQRLAKALTTLAGLYAGNPKRATARPTTERLLKRFEGLTLTIIREGHRRLYHLTPLSRVQRRILALLNFPVDIYTRLCPDSHKPP